LSLISVNGHERHSPSKPTTYPRLLSQRRTPAKYLCGQQRTRRKKEKRQHDSLLALSTATAESAAAMGEEVEEEV